MSRAPALQFKLTARLLLDGCLLAIRFGRFLVKIALESCPMEVKIRRALISVADKSGITDFARELVGFGVEIISTGGTAKLLRENQIPVLEVSEVTGYPEILEGRVKTLHPKIHGAILARRADKQIAEAARHGLRPIDLVAVNLYPFVETVKSGAGIADAFEQIDIGGVALLRAAAKNLEYVAVVSDPSEYPLVVDEMKRHNGATTLPLRLNLGRRAFARTAAYDAAIAQYLESLAADGRLERAEQRGLAERELLILEKQRDLRYGENPHQRAAFYRKHGSNDGLAAAEILQGKELSYNNILDLDAAWALVWEFEQPAACIIKHTNPCGVAVAETAAAALRKAFQTDPDSAFGSILAFNRAVDEAAAREALGFFVEAIIAPEFTAEARVLLSSKKNLRLLALPPERWPKEMVELRSAGGGFLLQERDIYYIRREELRVVTRRAPTPAEVDAMLFAWRVAKHVKSNAIVFASADRTLGVGAGQMSRVDSVRLAVAKSRSSLAGSALASDAFFPFRDGIDEAARAGATAIIQPGGSVRDREVIAAADEHNIAMVFTGIRHFRH